MQIPSPSAPPHADAPAPDEPAAVRVDLDALEPAVRAALRAPDTVRLRELVLPLHPADLADLLDRLDDADKIRVFGVLPVPLAAAVLDETSTDATREILAHLPARQAAAILEQLASDDAAAILDEDVPERQHELLAAMTPRAARDVRALLRFPPQSAGRLANDRIVRLRPTDTVADALAALRAVVHEAAVITYLYVVDADDRLVGTVSLRRLLVEPPGRPVAELMRPDPITVPPEMDQEQVAHLVSRYDLNAVPVVDAGGRVLGVVTVDDVVDVLVEEGTEDVLKLAAVAQGPPDETYFTTPVVAVLRRRVVWLLLLFLAGSLTANVLHAFEHALATTVALTFFIPLLIGTGGNIGAQTVSTLIRAMALDEVRLRDIWRALGREALVGLALGVLLGTIAFGRAWAQVPQAAFGLTVALAVVAICLWSNMIGVLVPMAARRVGIDPALVSAPLITTLVDASGLAIYLGIARLLLGV